MSFKDRLHSIEDEFLSALTQGEEAIVAFNTRWEGLLEEVNAALDANLLDDTTSILAHTTSLRVATLAETSASLFNSCDRLTIQFMDQIDSLMSQLDISGHRQDDIKSPVLSPSLSLHSCSPPPRHTRGTKRTRGDIDTPSPCKRRCRSPSGPIRHPKVVPAWKAATTDLPSNLIPGTAGSSTPLEDEVPRSRKRRLSDAAINPPHCPSKRLYVGPRLHSVSDSFAFLSTPSRIPSSPPPISAHHFVSACNTPAPESVEIHSSSLSLQRIESTEDHILALPQSAIPWSSHPSFTFADVWPSPVPPMVFDDCPSPLTHTSEMASVPPSDVDHKTTSSALSSPYPPTSPPLDSAIDPPHYCSMPSGSVGVGDHVLTSDWIGFDIPPPSFDEGLDHALLDGTWSPMLGIWDPSVWLAIPPPPYQLSSSAGFTLTKLNPFGSLDLVSLPNLGDGHAVDLDVLHWDIRSGAPLAALA